MYYNTQRDLLITVNSIKGIISTANPYNGVVIDTLLTHKDGIESFQVNSTGDKVVTVGIDNSTATGKAWSIINKSQLFSTDKLVTPRIAFISPDDELVFIVQKWFTPAIPQINVYKVSTGKLVVKLDGIWGKVTNLNFTENSSTVVANIDDGSVVSYNISKIVGVKNQDEKEHDFVCFPNPSNEQIEICKPMGFNESYPTHYKLVDVSGRVVSNLESKEATNVLDVHGIPNGIYFLTAQQATTIKSTTITIIR